MHVTDELVLADLITFLCCVLWTVDKFHSPQNLCLALTGEIGELAEIFQWKGSINGKPYKEVLKDTEMIHLGEEITDVFVYTIRLCDECHINIPAAISTILHGNELSMDGCILTNSSCWSELSFVEVLNLIKQHPISNLVHKPRDVIFRIIANIGGIAPLFMSMNDIHQEAHSSNSNSTIHSELSSESIYKREAWLFHGNWDDEQLKLVVSSLAHILISCSILCLYADLELASIVRDKMIKNNNKYPVDLVKGKSGKYTDYIEVIQARTGGGNINQN